MSNEQDRKKAKEKLLNLPDEQFDEVLRQQANKDPEWLKKCKEQRQQIDQAPEAQQ